MKRSAAAAKKSSSESKPTVFVEVMCGEFVTRVDADDAAAIVGATWLDAGIDLIAEGFSKLGDDLDLFVERAGDFDSTLGYAIFRATNRFRVLQGLVARERKRAGLWPRPRVIEEPREKQQKRAAKGKARKGGAKVRARSAARKTPR